MCIHRLKIFFDHFEIEDLSSRRQIREALRSNDLIKNLDAVQLQEVVSCMHEQTVPANCYIIREGDDGGHLYVGEEGEFEVSKGGKRLYIMGAGRCFGELALLYNCKRTASVKGRLNFYWIPICLVLVFFFTC
ncbi:unnamed protein product [Schistosoma curassoni]|uniref:Cyclic nucleotide-binding domain-containing protein n=1 Tax=Schistosoma curassoni TaxID=6186 RepID=A0A183JD86_9TREM|nr:unnamed protein product [Schistosoma curassoni]